MKRAFLLVLISIISVYSFFSCKKEKESAPDPFYVAAVSNGVLGKNDQVMIEFTNPQDISTPPASSFFSITPKVAGELSWGDEYTLIFTPSEQYKPGQQYQVRVSVPGVTAFNFDFMTAIPAFAVDINPVQINSDNDVLISGVILTDDDVVLADLEKTITSKDLGTPAWAHDSSGLHRFTFDAVARADNSRQVLVSWDGQHIGSNERGNSAVTIPGKDVFQMFDVRIVNGVIEVSFSSPIKENQDLRGFISLSGNTDIRYSVTGNTIRVFGDNSGNLIPGSELLIQDLVDINGKRLNAPVVFSVPNKWEVPDIRFMGRGVILPSSQGTNLVVETKNLTGLLVEAFQIYEHNMLQFLQNNMLSGTSEFDRVGQPVWTNSVDFAWNPADQNKWVRRGIDMSQLIRRFPGGMFHIRISFRPRHIQYTCDEAHGDFSHLTFPDDTFTRFTSGGERSYWDSYQSDPNFSWSDFNRYRNDPCHPAFYVPMSGHNITKGQNVLVSDLGLLAKRARDNSWVLSTTNLKEGRAAGGIDFKVYNYQGKVIHQGRTGSDGLATISSSVPEMSSGYRLFIYAESSLGRAYLRINDSIALSTSHFDVSGGTPSTGIRGLLYGERDVWRPGDDIYLTFLLSDPLNTLPANHPVSFELEDPRGRQTISRTFTNSVDSFYPIQVATSSGAPTGDWTARVRVGGSTFSKNIKIETVMPNRIKMNLDFAGEEVIKSTHLQTALSAEWLYGAPASGLKADVSVSFFDKETTFKSYPDYSFRDPSRSITQEKQNVFEGNLDKEGKTTFNMKLNPGTNVPGKVTARFMTRVFEPSGVFSSEQIQREYSPYSRYVGLKMPLGDAARNMLLTDTGHKAEIVVLDEDGKPAQGNVELECSLYKVSWRWWWESSRGETAEFASIISRTPLSRGNITAANGIGAWTFKVDYPDWGRFLILVRDKQGGHAAAHIVYIDWPGWAGRAREQGQTSSSMLTLTPEKAAFNTGERVAVSFPSNANASAHIVVEKGGQIIRNEWVRCAADTTKYEFAAEPSMMPNVYVHVTLLQPHMQTANDLPIRLYGIVPVTINDPNITLRPVIAAPENWQAESNVSFTVREANGRPMAYTVAVVDEGLLGLTRFTLPNPKNTFYAKEASFLRSWDLFAEVIGAYSGRLETLLAIGGSDDFIDTSDKETQRFKPVVRFFGPFELGQGGSKTETFELPPYIGAVRIMVLAASSTKEQNNRSQRAYGTAETPVKVTSDLMVFATLPRVLSVDDEVEIPVYVNSYTGGKRNVKVTLTVPGAEINGASSQDVAFDASGEKIVRFKVKAPGNPTALKFTVKAESSGLKTAQHVVDLDVRSTAIPVTKTANGLIAAGQTWRGDMDLPGRDGTNTLSIAFSRLRPLNLDDRLGYLIRYPHGCIEQTTSGAFPQVYLDKILNLDDKRRAEVRENVDRGIDRVLGMQAVSGGFSYWPGDSGAHDWSSSYAGHFLLEARNAGYNVRQSAISNWVRYQKNAAASWQVNHGFHEQAYRLYTLALAGEADIGSMNRLRSQRDLPIQARWSLASAYWYAGQRDTARNMIQGLAMPQGNYRQLSGTFGSALRDKAMILQTLVLVGTKDDAKKMSDLYNELADALSKDDWLSTQEIAYMLVAMAPYIQMNSDSGELSLLYSASGKSAVVNFTTPSTEEQLGNVTGTKSSYSVTNRSSTSVYVKVTSRGLPAEGQEPALSEGLALSVEYRSADGKVITPQELKLGDDMEIVVRLKNTYRSSVEEIAIVHAIPASWEIVNTRIGGSSQAASLRYQDIRDDRVMSYVNLNRDEEKVVRFRVNRAYEGSFFRPAIHAYAMYDESIRALIPGSR